MSRTRKIQYSAGLCAASNFMFTGAVISWPSPAIPKFLSGDANVEITEAQISWIASLFAIGAILGCFVGHPLLDRVGRRKALCYGSLPGIIGAAIILFTKTAEMLYFPRILCGISLGINAVVTMIYITEIADKEIRGALGMSVQVTNNFGSLIVYCIGPFVSYNMLNSLVLVIPVVNLVCCLWIPESPYYHIKEGRVAEARKEFVRLKGADDEKAQISWIASLFAIGAILGCFVGHPLLDRVGRRKALCYGSLPGIIGAAIILFTKTAEMLYFPRILCGISLGINAVVTMIYITEIADKEIRGALGMSVQVTNNFGSLIVYCIGPFVSYNMLNSLVLVIPVVNLVCCLWIPESPYYHIKEGRVAEARKEFVRLKGADDEKWIDEQIGIIRAHVRESMENKTTLWELVSNNKYRKALYIVTGLKMLQYMTGGMAIQAYLEVIFRQSSSISGPYVSIVYGFVQLLTGVGGALLAGYFGRRILMFISDLGVALSLTALGSYFYLQDTVKLAPDILSNISFLPLIGLFGFNIFYSVGIGMLPYVMQAELFPINVKTVASSSATVMACCMNFVITKCYHGIKAALGHSAVFWAFAIVAYLGLFFIYFFVPETKDKSLEEVQDNIMEQEGTALKEMEQLN